jgi:hypothetical protein
MPRNNPFIKEETKASQLFHSDGAAELIAGAVLLNFWIDLLNNDPFSSLFSWIPILLFSSIKNRYTVPRIGYKELGVDEKQTRKWTAQTAIGIAIAFLTISTLLLSDPLGLESKLSISWGGDYRCLVYGVVAGLFILIGAWRIPIKRFNIYAAIAFGSSLICYFFLPVTYPVVITAAVMLVMGIRMSMQFSKKYPDPEQETKGKAK